MKSLLITLLIIGGISYFNYKSKTELESAKCETSIILYGYVKTKYDNFPSAENQDKYGTGMLKLVENCTLIDIGKMAIAGADGDKINRFLENTK